MGTVKIGNIKQRRHLKNSIEYIFRPDKTKNGAYIFGDSGYTPQMVCDTFYVTKKFFGKEDGRQAYHFVLTFAEEDDINPAMAEEITKELMAKMFPHNEYNWAGAVHIDTDHIHSHIIFNSVNNITGLKYRYNKGDWGKHIQKIVDDICYEKGFRTIAYEYDDTGQAILKNDNPKGTHHEKHNREIKSKADIIREDIDRCIAEADTYNAFLTLMKEDGYNIREGKSTKYGDYITFRPYGVEKGLRSYRLGDGYGKSEIIERINKHESVIAEKRQTLDNREYGRIITIHKIPTITYRRYYVKHLYIARRWRNKQTFPGSYVYKKAIIEYEKLEDEWRLFRRANFQSVDYMEEYRKKLDEELKACYRNKRNLPQGSEERDAVDKQIKEYYHNKRVLARIEKRIDEQQLDGQERQTRAADKGRRDR